MIGRGKGMARVAGVLVAAAGLAAPAAAQGPGAPYPAPGMGPMAAPAAGRWGSDVDGRWWGGANAPGGWSAYRPPYRGYRLPGYWNGQRFRIDDWAAYGFPAPPAGYHWSRYYDDAVLADARGGVYDWRGGTDWNGYGAGYAAQPGYGEAPYPRRDQRHGLAGAAVGAAAGGVAGNLIAGRGNRLGGTLIGAGVGGAAGYAIGHREDGYRAPPPPPPGAGYPAAGYFPERGYEPGPGYPPPPATWRSADGATTVTVTTAGAAPAYGYGYGYAAGGAVTTVTVQSAPVVTTTTTEIVDDTVYTRAPAVRRAYVRRHAWHPRRRQPCVIGS